MPGWHTAVRSWVLLQLVREFESERIPADLIESILDRNGGNMTASFLELDALADQDFFPDFTKEWEKSEDSDSQTRTNQKRFDYGPQTPSHFLSYADAMNDARIVGSEKSDPIKSTQNYQNFATELGVRQMFVRQLADLWAGFDYQVNLQYSPSLTGTKGQSEQFCALRNSIAQLGSDYWTKEPVCNEIEGNKARGQQPMGTLTMEFYNH